MSTLIDMVWNELARVGRGPRLVRVSLHPVTLAELSRERDAPAPDWGVKLPPIDQIFGFHVAADELAPRGVILIRERR